jgi:ATP:cob(I)alamin adenosyltransferase
MPLEPDGQAMDDSRRKFYTRRGDRGQTRLLSGETLQKDDLRVNTYGALDELASHLGMARALVQESDFRDILYSIQKDVSTACSELASTPGALSRLKRRLNRKDVLKIENWIDDLVDRFGTPRDFRVAGESPDSAALHIARSVCRRGERRIVRLNRLKDVHGDLVAYFNRLSDLLFVMAWTMELKTVTRRVIDELAGPRPK